MIRRILAALLVVGLTIPAVAVAQLPANRDAQEFVDAFLITERAKLVARVHREGDQFEAGRELDKLRQKHEKVFGRPISDEMLADFDRLARDAAAQAPDPALLDPDSGKRKNPSDVYPDLYLAGVKVKFMEDIREEGNRFDTTKEMAKVAERFERNFGAPFPNQPQFDLGRVAEQARTVISEQRAASPLSTAAPNRTAGAAPSRPTVNIPLTAPIPVVRGVRYPDGLPEWFAAHDKNQDGQVGLYEWERDKLADFKTWDANGDGFLEPLEVLSRHQKLTGAKGNSKVKLEIIKAEYGSGDIQRDVTATLRKQAGDSPVIPLPSSYNSTFGGDPASGRQKQLKIWYRLDGKRGEAAFAENARIMLPLP